MASLRPAGADRREGLLAGGFPVCDNPACDCGEVQVELQGVDDGLMRAVSSGDRLRLEFVPDRRRSGGLASALPHGIPPARNASFDRR